MGYLEMANARQYGRRSDAPLERIYWDKRLVQLWCNYVFTQTSRERNNNIRISNSNHTKQYMQTLCSSSPFSCTNVCAISLCFIDMRTGHAVVPTRPS